jgi:hypothetical protein
MTGLFCGARFAADAQRLLCYAQQMRFAIWTGFLLARRSADLFPNFGAATQFIPEFCSAA